MEQGSAGPIEYAPAERPMRRRLRKLRVPGILLALAIAAYVSGPTLWFRVQLVYWQSKCADHVAPADTVVARDPIGRRLWTSPTTFPAVRPVGVIPIAWTRFYGMVSPPGLQTRGTAFLHARRTPAGERVLVAVDYLGNSDVIIGARGSDGAVSPPFALLQFHVRTFEPGNALRLPVQLRHESVGVEVPATLPRGSRAGELRVFAGQSDPDDPTHFTIGFEAGETGGVIDGWVREYHVDLELRPAPTPPPPPSPE